LPGKAWKTWLGVTSRRPG